MFKASNFSDKKAIVYLGRIADALDVIALHFAGQDNRMWTPRHHKVSSSTTEEAEVLHTRDEDMLVAELKKYLEFQGKGYDE